MQLTDTLTNTRQELLPALADDDVVRMYVCGVTPYAESHVGHALHAIVFDVLRRYLDWRGILVRHVQNFTDIDDKLIDRAQRLGVPMSELAEQNISDYFAQLKAMNVQPAHVYPRVTETVPQIIASSKGSSKRDLPTLPGRRVLPRAAVRWRALWRTLAAGDRRPDERRPGTPTELKDDPLDFALWKGAKPGEPSWDSPGGRDGGWHIECSAMALENLGDQIDIHGGGADLIFPHHSNEIAQTEAYTDKPPFARIWMHNALLQLGSEKMSKSIGNLVTIQEALDQYGPDALRLFVITSHYRSPVTYTEDALEAAKSGADRLRNAAFVAAGGGGPALDAGPYRQRFIEAMEDDLNTPRALAAMFDLAREVNRAGTAGQDISDAQAALRELCGVLGLTLQSPARQSQEAAPFIDLLITLRTELRAAKQWAIADQVRDGLTALGVEIKDSAEGTTWSLK